MARWEQLRDKLEDCLSVKAWFQPPSDVFLEYPVCVFEFSRHVIRHADNRTYLIGKQYTITIMDADPESTLPDKLVENFPTVRFDRSFAVEGINHYVYTLYF